MMKIIELGDCLVMNLNRYERLEDINSTSDINCTSTGMSLRVFLSCNLQVSFAVVHNYKRCCEGSIP